MHEKDILTAVIASTRRPTGNSFSSGFVGILDENCPA